MDISLGGNYMYNDIVTGILMYPVMCLSAIYYSHVSSWWKGLIVWAIGTLIGIWFINLKYGSEGLVMLWEVLICRI
jgi:hypothetical protein